MKNISYHLKFDIAVFGFVYILFCISISEVYCNNVQKIESQTITATINPERDVVTNADDTTSYLPDLRQILKDGKLIVAQFNGERFPFFFTGSDGSRIGMDRDLAIEIAHSIDPNLQVEVLNTATTFNEVIEQVQTGQAHIGISKLSYTQSRAKHVLFITPPYVDLKVSFLIDRVQLAKLSSNISVGEIFSKENNQTLCVLNASSQVDSAQFLLPHARLVYADSADDSYEKLFAGQCTAVFYDDNEFRLKFMQNPSLNLRYKAVSLSDKGDPISIVVNSHLDLLARFISTQFSYNVFKPRHLPTEIKKYQGYLK